MKISKKVVNRISELNSLIEQVNKLDENWVELRDDGTWPTIYEFVSAKINKTSITFSFSEPYEKKNKVTNECIKNEEDAIYYLSLYIRSIKYHLKRN